VPATSELRADESTPAISAVSGKDGDRPAVDAYSELMRRAKNAPLNFSFAWYGMDFGGILE